MMIRKHVTLRNLSDSIIEEGIDETIERGMARIQEEQTATAIQLVNAMPFFRHDGICFVTIIVDVVTEDEQEKSAGKVYRAKKKEQ